MRQTPLILGAALTLAACGGDNATEPQAGPTGPKPVSSVLVTPNTQTLTAIDATQQFQASAKDAAGTTISGKSFTWASSSPPVASVSSTGLTTAVTDGSSTITATVDEIVGSAALVVTQAAAEMSLAGGDNQIGLAATALGTPLSTKVADSFDNGIEGVAVGWSVTSGSGSLASATSTTDAGGIATKAKPR